jgi:hypothetical protein
MNSSGSMTIWVVPSFVRTLQLQHDLPGAITFEPFVGDGRPGDIAAEMLEFCTLIGAPAHRRICTGSFEFNSRTSCSRLMRRRAGIFKARSFWF